MRDPWLIFFETWSDLAVRLRDSDQLSPDGTPFSVVAARSETIYHLLADCGCPMREATPLVDALVAAALDHLRTGDRPEALRERLRATGEPIWSAMGGCRGGPRVRSGTAETAG